MNLKSRKLIGASILIILATILALGKTMEATLFNGWANFVFLMYSAYVVGNVSGKYVYNKAVDSKPFNNKAESPETIIQG